MTVSMKKDTDTKKRQYLSKKANSGTLYAEAGGRILKRLLWITDKEWILDELYRNHMETAL